MKQIPREVTISGKSGIKYKGVLTAGENSVFKSDCYILKNPNKLLKNIVVDEQGMITLDSLFKPINISDISDDISFPVQNLFPKTIQKYTYEAYPYNRQAPFLLQLHKKALGM